MAGADPGLLKCTTTKMYYYMTSYSQVLLLRRVLRARMATEMYYYEDVLLHDQLQSGTTTEKGPKGTYGY